MTIRNFFAIVEIRTKVVSLSSFTLGTLYAALTQGRVFIFRTAVMLLATLAVDMGTTAWNSYFDYLRGTDDHRFNREEDKVLVHAGVPPSAAFIVSAALFSLAVVLGLVLSAAAGLWVAFAGAACMAVGFLYNGGPLPISHTPFGELFAGGFLGTGLFLISFGVQFPSGPFGPGAGSLLRNAFLASLPLLLGIASILSVNNTCDMEGDKAAGRKTLSILLGRTGGEILVFSLGLLACGGLVLFAAAGILPKGAACAGAAAAVFSGFEYRRMHRRGFSHSTKGPNMGSVSRVFAVFSLSYAAVLVAALI